MTRRMEAKDDEERENVQYMVQWQGKAGDSERREEKEEEKGPRKEEQEAMNGMVT